MSHSNWPGTHGLTSHYKGGNPAEIIAEAGKDCVTEREVILERKGGLSIFSGDGSPVGSILPMRFETAPVFRLVHVPIIHSRRSQILGSQQGNIQRFTSFESRRDSVMDSRARRMRRRALMCLALSVTVLLH